MRFALALVAVWLAALVGRPSHAASLTWTGAAGTLWSSPGNWQPSGVPANGDILMFPPAAGLTSNTNDLNGLALDRIDLTGDGYVLGGNAITVATIRSASSMTNTLAMPIAVPSGMAVHHHSTPTAGGTVRLTGGLSGGGSLSAAAVTLHVAGPSSYLGQILLTCGFELPCGQLRLDGASIPSASVAANLQIGAVQAPNLWGHGTVGDVSGASISPGSSTGSFGPENGTGVITIADVAFVDSGRSVSMDIQGAAPGAGYDQIVVSGTVNLSNAQLRLEMGPGFVPSVGQVFTLIDNDATEPVNGTFAGLPQGSTVTAGGVDLQVSYAGGDGNDVTLTVTRVPRTWSGAAGNLWSNAGNWMGGVIPQSGDRLRFPAGAANLSNTNDLAGLSLHSIVFEGAGYALGGNGVVLTNAISVAAGASGNVVAIPVDVQANAVSIALGRESLRLTSALAGNGPVAISAGELALSGASTYSGAITVACPSGSSCGRLRLEAVSLPRASVSAELGSVDYVALSGSGTVGTVTGASISPCPPGGDSCTTGIAGSTAILSTGSLSGARSVHIGIDGASPGSGYDQIAVTGTVTLDGTLVASKDPAFNPTPGQVFTIIGNDASDPVTGRFGGLPQGGMVNLGGTQFRISYAGGDGNDVTLTALSGSPRLVNISTRAQVLTGNDVTIGGFVIGGSAPKTVVVRARGPSLAGVPGTLADPLLQLFSGQTQIAANDNWQDAANSPQLRASDLAPAHPLESAILATLQPGPYTAIMSGAGATTGIGIVEVFEADQPEVPLVNIATRSRVATGDNVMIAGFVIQGTSPQTIVVRARGPSLAAQQVPGALPDPVLSLYSGQNVIMSNNDWQTGSNAALLQASGLAPPDPKEAAIYITLNPGAYTAIVQGAGGTTGAALVEVFAVQ